MCPLDVFQIHNMDDLHHMERGTLGEVEDANLLNSNIEETDEENNIEEAHEESNNEEPPSEVMRCESEEDRHTRTFFKVVEIFGDKQKAGLRKTLKEEFGRKTGGEVVTKRNKIDLLKLNSVIERLENPINPVNVMNRSNRYTQVRHHVKNQLQIEDKDEDQGYAYMSESEFLALHQKQVNGSTADPKTLITEKKILDYIQKIADAKKLVKWPPPWFSLVLTIIHLILFLVTNYNPESDVLTEHLQFDT